MENARSMPVAPLFERSVTWIKQTLIATGAQIRLGLELYPVFLAAGLPGPSMRVDALIGGGSQCAAYEILATVIDKRDDCFMFAINGPRTRYVRR